MTSRQRHAAPRRSFYNTRGSCGNAGSSHQSRIKAEARTDLRLTDGGADRRTDRQRGGGDAAVCRVPAHSLKRRFSFASIPLLAFHFPSSCFFPPPFEKNKTKQKSLDAPPLPLIPHPPPSLPTPPSQMAASPADETPAN